MRKSKKMYRKLWALPPCMGRYATMGMAICAVQFAVAQTGITGEGASFSSDGPFSGFEKPSERPFSGLNAQKARFFKKEKEIGLFVGTFNQNGDVSTTYRLESVLKEAKMNAGVFYRQGIYKSIVAGVELSYGTLYGDDRNHTNPQRDYSFKTDVFQTNLFGEFFLKEEAVVRGNPKSWFNPYLRVGTGLAWIQERQTTQEAIVQKALYTFNDRAGFLTVNAFVGVGIKYYIDDIQSVFVNLDYHYSGTDRVEGWEFNDNQSGNDVWYTLRVGYSINFTWLKR